MELKWKTHKWDFNPTLAQLQAIVAAEYCVMDVHRGTLVKSVAVRINTAFTAGAPTVSVGDDVSLIGLVKTTDVTIGTAGLYNGTGTYLCTPAVGGSAANGKLYTTDDTIEINYTGAALTTQGALSVEVVYCEIE